MKDAHAKAKEIFVEKKYLQDSLDALLLRQKDLENDVSDLKDEVLSAAGVYFEWSKEQVLFLYPNLDLSPLDPFKAVKGGAIVDEESTTSLEPEFFPHYRNYGVRKGGELESLILEYAFMEEEP